MRFKKIRRMLRLYEKGVINMTDPEVKQYFKRSLGKLDPSLEHVQGHLFYSHHVVWELLERTPEKNMPNLGIIFNMKTKQAYLAGQHALNLMAEHKIQWVTSEFKNPEQSFNRIQDLMINLGLTMNWRPAVTNDLKEA